jgi:hypothetical protein
VAATRYWLLRLVLPGRWGRWLTGALVFCGLLLIYALFGGLFESQDAPLDEPGRPSPGVVVFFCVILGYIIPVHHLIVGRSLTAFDQLKGHFTESEEQLLAWRRRIEHKSRRWVIVTLFIGVLAGMAHNLVLGSFTALQHVAPSFLNLLTMSTTTLVWLIMTAAITSLIDNAILFRRLALRIPLDLLNTHRLTPFGTVAVSSTLAMIGAQAAFPVMMLDDEVSWVTFVPGLLATGAPMILMFLLPILPIHARILSAKRAELDRVSGEIGQLSRSGPAVSYEALNPRLIYRREITAVSEWPFDTSVMGRLAIYLIIPPLTWIGAALIEILIDAAL